MRAPTPLPQGEASAFGARVPAGNTAYANSAIAQAFVDIALGLESGGQRPGLLRLRAPVRLRLEGHGAVVWSPFTANYAEWLQRRTGLDIALSPADGPGPIEGGTLRLFFVPAAALARAFPGAACIHLPGAAKWRRVARAPRRAAAEAGASAGGIAEATVFIAASADAERIRRCILEEIPQAMGLSNDHPGLGPTAFNDDAAHSWPTALDLLLLRLLYAPELAPFLEAPLGDDALKRAALRALARLNPQGLAGRIHRPLEAPALKTAQGWSRVTEPKQALEVARATAPGTLLVCTSLVRRAARLLDARPAATLRTLEDAEAACARHADPGGPRRAAMALLRAEAQLALGRPTAALDTSATIGPVLAGHGLEAGLARLYALRAEAFHATGDAIGAAKAERRRDAWRRYARGTGGGENGH